MVISQKNRILLSRLNGRESHAFRVEVSDALRQYLVELLDLVSLRKLRFEGALHPVAARDWQLRADLGATVVQPCVVTLDPVTTRIDQRVDITYVAGFDEPTAAESEMDSDDSVEALVEEIDLESVLAEALALHVPDYPRKEGVALANAVSGHEDTSEEEERQRPFAGLGDLRDKLREREQ